MRAFFIYKDAQFSADNKGKGMVSKHILAYVKDFEIFLADELRFYFIYLLFFMSFSW